MKESSPVTPEDIAELSELFGVKQTIRINRARGISPAFTHKERKDGMVTYGAPGGESFTPINGTLPKK